jgi:hypothetical protein
MLWRKKLKSFPLILCGLLHFKEAEIDCRQFNENKSIQKNIVCGIIF